MRGIPLLLALAACGPRNDAAPPASPLPLAEAPEPEVPPSPEAPAVPPLPFATAVAVGDCDRVLAAREEAGTDAARLAVGWCAHDRDPDAALAFVDGIDALLAPYAAWVRAKAHLAAGRPADALAALEGVSLPGDLGLEVRLARARALLALHRSLDARDDLRALLDTAVGDEARFLLAEGARDRGDLAAAITTWRAVWTTSVRGPWAARAAEALAAAGAPVPDLSSAEGRAAVRARAGALRKAGLHEEALDLLLRLAEAEGTALPDAELGRTAFRARRYALVKEAWGRAFGPPEQATAGPVDLFDYAVALLRAGDRPGSEAAYRRVIALHPSHAKAEEARFKLAYVAYDAGDCDTALPRFDAYLAAHPRGKEASSALWFQGWCRWRAGDHAGAVATWDRLERSFPTSSLVPGVRYWKARALGLAGDVEAERAALRSLITTHPTSGHAWFAAVRVGHRFPARPAVQPPPFPEALAGHPSARRGLALLDAGLTRWAATELAAVPASLRTDRASALALAHALARAGDGRRGRELARPYCEPAWKEGDPVAQQACWPRVAVSVVEPTAARWGLPPLLPYAIMEAESALDPEVTSYAGARGLMQVMPFETARLHRAALGRDDGDPDDLYLAAYNALLGTTLLGLNAEALSGALDPDPLPAVIASYNGGLDAVRRWVAASPVQPVPFDVFAEEVGYTQTRQYVRHVLGYLMGYLWVYGDAEPDAP